ncbi:hypothetical protein E4T56_gene8887, partial [Termitomyces sp. T112]
MASAFSTVTSVPGLKPIFEGDCEAATGETVSAVMILVTDAGYQGIVALFACSTRPLSASTTSHASASARLGRVSAIAATAIDPAGFGRVVNVDIVIGIVADRCPRAGIVLFAQLADDTALAGAGVAGDAQLIAGFGTTIVDDVHIAVLALVNTRHAHEKR